MAKVGVEAPSSASVSTACRSGTIARSGKPDTQRQSQEEGERQRAAGQFQRGRQALAEQRGHGLAEAVGAPRSPVATRPR